MMAELPKYARDAPPMRETSAKVLATIPSKFTPNFAEQLDKRTSIAKTVLERIAAIETDAGGDGLSHARRSLIRRVVWLECIVENNEQQLASGAGIDLGAHTQAVNSLLGLYRVIGLERRQRPVRRLHEIMSRT